MLTLIEKNKIASEKAKAEFIPRSNLKHNNKYDYSLVEYVNNCTKVRILCPIHGVFEQRPDKHLRGQGCAKCASNVRALALKRKGKERVAKAKSEFVSKAQETHGNRYDYSLVEYKNNRAKIKIICREHGEFEQEASSHLRGQGCPHCARAESGFTRTKFKQKCIKNNNGLGILYILECFNENERFIKIGITSNSIKERYGNKTLMPYEYKTLYEILGEPVLIYDLETLLHNNSSNYKYRPNIPFGGSMHECFEANKEYINDLNIYINNLNNIIIRSAHE